MRKLITATLSAAVFTVVATYSGIAQQNQMSFFVTSAGPGNGANLGGLAGADKQCQTLAAAYCARATECGYMTDTASCQPYAEGLIGCSKATGVKASYAACVSDMGQVPCTTFGDALPPTCDAVILQSFAGGWDGPR